MRASGCKENNGQKAALDTCQEAVRRDCRKMTFSANAADTELVGSY